MSKNGARRQQLVIPVSGLEDRDYPFDFETDAESLDLQEKYRGDIFVSGKISRVGNELYVRGTVGGVAYGDCDRCLVATEKPVEREFLAYFRPSTGESADVEEEEIEESIYALPATANTVSLDAEIRQTLLLGVPLKNLCSEGCRGICLSCGKNLNEGDCRCAKAAVDPRFAALEGLMDRSDSEDTDQNDSLNGENNNDAE